MQFLSHLSMHRHLNLCQTKQILDMPHLEWGKTSRYHLEEDTLHHSWQRNRKVDGRAIQGKDTISVIYPPQLLLTKRDLLADSSAVLTMACGELG